MKFNKVFSGSFYRTRTSLGAIKKITSAFELIFHCNQNTSLLGTLMFINDVNPQSIIYINLYCT